MTSTFDSKPLPQDLRSCARFSTLAFSAFVVALGTYSTLPTMAQAPAAVAPASTSEATTRVPGEWNIKDSFELHQSIEIGGHITAIRGSLANYDTMLNIHQGPRILNESIDLRALPTAKNTPFDRLTTNSFGYGGDPVSVTFLNMSKGRAYDFHGSFRRSRSYFDYDLLANPLIPATSVPDVPILDSPHLYNTVRKNTDLNLTLAPISPVSLRIGYNKNDSTGPSYSSIHYGADAELLQNWNNLTQTLDFGLDAKLPHHSSFSYDHLITAYRGSTSWSLTGLDYALANGTAVAQGTDMSSVWSTPCAGAILSTGYFNPKCNGTLSYSRVAPTRVLTPTDQVRFIVPVGHTVEINGRAVYSDGILKLQNFNEQFNGLETRSTLRAFQILGNAQAVRINTSGDLAASWKVTHSFVISNVWDWNYFHIPGTNSFTETDYSGSSMLVAPSATPSKVTTTTDQQFLGQKNTTDTVLAAWQVWPRAGFSLGYRYGNRDVIAGVGSDLIIHTYGGLFGANLQPTPQWHINLNADLSYADKAYTRVSPRQADKFTVRSTYKPKSWLTLAGTVNIHENRDNVQYVNHLDHARDFSFGAVVAPSDKWSFDLNYAYDSVYSTTVECYTVTPAPSAPTPAADPACVTLGTKYQFNDIYNVPTQTGSIGFVLNPVERVHGAFGYRATGVNGTTSSINLNQVPGSLQSVYSTPYANLAFDLEKSWQWKAEYNYADYGETSAVGSTAPRNFHGNLYTLSVRYAF